MTGKTKNTPKLARACCCCWSHFRIYVFNQIKYIQYFQINKGVVGGWVNIIKNKYKTTNRMCQVSTLVDKLQVLFTLNLLMIFACSCLQNKLLLLLTSIKTALRSLLGILMFLWNTKRLIKITTFFSFFLFDLIKVICVFVIA